ncbi:MAG: hypothetical protein M1497_03665 [Nitrospirae bacterium]|nr:hypothetical protein [Nitrospirota bacterium]
MAELGQLEKPDAGSFAGKRKLYCVADVYPLKDAPDDYTGLVNRYWDEVERQTAGLERAGKIVKIFCESISAQGDEALAALEKLNEKVHGMVKRRVQEGAVLLPVEEEEILAPFLDWANCLNVVRTKEVFVKVFGFYTDLAEKRLRHAAGAIGEGLGQGEAGLLIMRDEDRVRLQLPEDIEIFLVTPPSYDDILKWLRQRLKEHEPETQS